jgi:hypothetical protein
MASTVDALTIINNASLLLEDIGAVNWTTSELLAWLNMSQVEMVNLSPRTNVKNVKQSLPADGILLFDIPYNYKANGTFVSGAINAVPLQVLNKRLPGWTTVAASQTVKHYAYNPSDPRVFYVYPAQPTLSTYVEMAYAATPAVIPNATAGTNITVDDQYQNVLLNLVLAKALAKDGEYGNNAVKAREYRLLAEQELGLGAVTQNPTDQAQKPQPKK